MPLKTLISRALSKAIYPLLPGRLRLPFRYWLCAFDGSLEPECRMLAALVSQRHVAIDVGANFGLYAFRMSTLFSKVYAFEVNDDLTGDLIKYNPGNIEIMHGGLSSKPGDATLYIPVVHGLSLTGWASLTPGNCPGADEHITKVIRLQTLDSFKLDHVSFIKIDVEGHELDVLQGAKRTLTECRPTVLIEIKERNRESVFEFFRDIDYVYRASNELLDAEGSSENHIFVPRSGQLEDARDGGA